VSSSDPRRPRKASLWRWPLTFARKLWKVAREVSNTVSEEIPPGPVAWVVRQLVFVLMLLLTPLIRAFVLLRRSERRGGAPDEPSGRRDLEDQSA
jgi:hypothetical protein